MTEQDALAIFEQQPRRKDFGPRDDDAPSVGYFPPNEGQRGRIVPRGNSEASREI